MVISLPHDYDNEARITRFFGRERSIHEILGGGKVGLTGGAPKGPFFRWLLLLLCWFNFADVLLWREKAISGAVFIGMLAIWFLFEVAEYNLVTFICHLTITSMLIIFIWSNGAKVFKWSPPEVPNILLEESMIYRDACEKLNFLLSRLIYIACGNDIKLFCLVILTISMLSTIGNYITTLNLLFIGLVCMGTLPYLYEKHEEEVDNLYDMLYRRSTKIYEMFDRKVVSQIPRWPLKHEKFN